MPPPNDPVPYKEKGVIPQAANEFDVYARKRIWELPVNKLFPKTTFKYKSKQTMSSYLTQQSSKIF